MPSFAELAGREVGRVGRDVKEGEKVGWWEEEDEGPDENGVFRSALDGAFGWM